MLEAKSDRRLQIQISSLRPSPRRRWGLRGGEVGELNGSEPAKTIQGYSARPARLVTVTAIAEVRPPDFDEWTLWWQRKTVKLPVTMNIFWNMESIGTPSHDSASKSTERGDNCRPADENEKVR